MRSTLDVQQLGQVFTPGEIVALMLSLRENTGRVLEPSCGDGAFAKHLTNCDAIEVDSRVAPSGSIVGDFFAWPLDRKYSTVIGNPPYVRYQDIPRSTRELLDGSLFDGRSNLALFFIHKAVLHLAPGGELIFIVPREFIKLTAARKLNAWMAERGTITHWIETGDTRIFSGSVPNCAIFRYEMGNFSGKTQFRTLQTGWDERRFVQVNGQISFPRSDISVPLADIFDVKVGAVSGADSVFSHPDGVDFVFSKTIDGGKTRKMIYNRNHPALGPHKNLLLSRRVRHFDESNWWLWGRTYHDAPGAPRIYVNGRTRRSQPFFTHPCEAYDGSILALFPKDSGVDIDSAVRLLNTAVPWEELGFVVDGRFLFTQRSLSTLLLPVIFDALRTGGRAATSP